MAKAKAGAAEQGIVNQMVAVDLCSPHPQNYNQHDESQIADLRASLRRFGQVRSIVVQDDGAGGFLLVAGHGVHAAARAEGLAELRADVIPADWTPARVLAYLAADNELARRGLPDEAQLAAIIEQIQREADEELARLAAGGEERLAELEALLAQENAKPDPGPQIDRAEELQAKWQCARGQIWQIGRHRLMCGDSTDAGDTQSLLENATVDMVSADPPYGIGLLSKRGNVGLSKPYDPTIGDEDSELAKKLFGIWRSVAPLQVWWGANHYGDILEPSDCWLVWDKDHHGMTFADAELAWTNIDGPVRVLRHAWSGADRDSEKGEERLHPNQKPVALFAWYIELYTAPDAIVADPCAGVGGQMIACEQLGRAIYAMEKVPKYCSATLERLAGMGLEPRLVDG